MDEAGDEDRALRTCGCTILAHGNTLAAPGAGLRDLMTRMGHDSPRMLIYPDATSEADQAIALAEHTGPASP